MTDQLRCAFGDADTDSMLASQQGDFEEGILSQKSNQVGYVNRRSRVDEYSGHLAGSNNICST
jgi:hypothetical protein